MNLLLVLLLLLAVVAGVLLKHDAWRQKHLSSRIHRMFRRVMPPLSDTEREALNAGTAWWEGELFSGRPSWNKLQKLGRPALSGEEQAFLDNEVAALCELVDDWEVSTQRFELPPAAWQYMKENGFLGLIIPREYGGKGVSALAHSEVVR